MSDGWFRGTTIGFWEKAYPKSCWARIIELKGVFSWELHEQVLEFDEEGEDYRDLILLNKGQSPSLAHAMLEADEAYIDAVVNP